MRIARFYSAFVLVLVLALSLIGAAATSAQQTPPDGLITFLDNGVPVQGSFSGMITANLYAFHASVGNVISIAMNQADATSTLDPYIVLLGSRGEVLASDDDSGGNLASLISGVTIPADGSYYVVATSYSYLNATFAEAGGLTSAQPYTITLTGNTPPVNMPGFDPTLATFASTALVSGAPVQGYSNAQEPVYFFTFDGNAGDIVDVVLSNATFDTLLYLFDTNGQRIAVNDDAAAGNTTSEIRGVVLPAAGQYLVFATGYGYPGAATLGNYTGGDFTIQMSVVGTGAAVPPAATPDKAGSGAATPVPPAATPVAPAVNPTLPPK